MTNVLKWPVAKVGEPSVIDGMPADVYHNHKSISSSGLRTIIDECPQAYYYNSVHNPNRPPEEKKLHFNIGSAAHDLLLQAGEFHKHNFVLPQDFNGRTKDGRKLKADKEGEGFNVITHEQYAQVAAMVDAIKAHPYASGAFVDGVAERSIFWRDEETGVVCRCRPDFLPNDFKNVPDYKSTVSAKPSHIYKSIAQYGYYMQHAWYMEGIERATGKRPQRFFFVFQEKTPPYITTCVVPDEEAIHYGQKLNRKALRIYAQCLEKDEWPGYADGVMVASLPVWKAMELDTMEQEGEL